MSMGVVMTLNIWFNELYNGYTDLGMSTVCALTIFERDCVLSFHTFIIYWPPADHLPTTYWPPTDQPHADHLATTYGPPTNHLATTYQPPTDHLWTTYQPPTDYLWTTYRPLFAVQLVQYYRALQCNLGIAMAWNSAPKLLFDDFCGTDFFIYIDMSGSHMYQCWALTTCSLCLFINFFAGWVGGRSELAGQVERTIQEGEERKEKPKKWVLECHQLLVMHVKESKIMLMPFKNLWFRSQITTITCE